jgi:hypothetical protein
MSQGISGSLGTKGDRVGTTDVGGRFRCLATALFGAIAAGGAVDLALDRPTTFWSVYVLFEVSLLTLSLGAVAYLWLGWRDVGRKLEQTRAELEARGAERDAWCARAEKLLRELGEEIDQQLREWGVDSRRTRDRVTPTQGLRTQRDRRASKKERAHGAPARCGGVPKSGLSGRAELSAFFLEDLLLPVDGV